MPPLIDRITRIRQAAGNGLLRWFKTYEHRIVVEVPREEPLLWDDPANCDEYGVPVAMTDYHWHHANGRSIGKMLARELEPLFETAPFIGHWQPTKSAAPCTLRPLGLRIRDAAARGRLVTYRLTRFDVKRVAVVVPSRDPRILASHELCEEYGVVVALWKHGGWRRITGAEFGEHEASLLGRAPRVGE